MPKKKDKIVPENIEVLGKLAMELIADYPLYAKTSGITYAEAILLALVLYPDHKKWAELVEQL